MKDNSFRFRVQSPAVLEYILNVQNQTGKPASKVINQMLEDVVFSNGTLLSMKQINEEIKSLKIQCSELNKQFKNNYLMASQNFVYLNVILACIKNYLDYKSVNEKNIFPQDKAFLNKQYVLNNSTLEKVIAYLNKLMEEEK